MSKVPVNNFLFQPLATGIDIYFLRNDIVLAKSTEMAIKLSIIVTDSVTRISRKTKK